jgi:sigma-B regulation protein RsbU (phosphoserine phosphatase)
VAPVTPGPSRARDFFEVYTKDLSAGDLQKLFTRDAREAYAFFARGIDREQLGRLPWHIRLLTHLRLFLMAFSMRLSPARRMLYAAALIFSILGVINLFSGIHVVRLDPIPLAYPLPEWRDGTFAIVTGFILLNLLIVMEVADRLSLKHDLNVAREIQLAMLPSGTYRAPGIEIHGETRPANTVGGDFYDLIPQADGRVLVALGDVAGKGSPAALLMALLLAILRTLVDEGLDLPTLAARLNSQVARHAPPSRFITLFLGMYDPTSDHLTWLNAGQNPPMIRRASGEWVKLAATGVALGMFEGSPYEDDTTTLASGDVLVMYSDGITEAESTAGVPFEEQGLQSVVNAWIGGSAPELSAAVLRAVNQHVGDARVADDLTVLVLKRQ